MGGEHGTSVAAGPVTFVVEHRTVVQDGAETGGPTVRVLGGSDEHEYLRLDMFHVSPHYHYEPPGEPERVLMLDTDAEGDAVAWGIARLRNRLAPMLVAAGGRGHARAPDAPAPPPASNDGASTVGAPP